MFFKRRQVLEQELKKKQVNVVIVNHPSNLYYYTGFTGGEAFLVMLISDKAEEKLESYIITDSRYYEQVEKECPDLKLVKLEKKGYSQIVKELLEVFIEKQQIPAKGAQIAIEESMNLSQYLKLCEVCSMASFKVYSEMINSGRKIKDDEELEKIRTAESIGDAAFSYILGIIKPGMTEAEIALELEYYMKKQGGSKLSFDTIVASGPNSSMPHAQVTNRKIEQGDFITMDFGCVYQGYCSDMTRTIAVGKTTQEMEKVYQIVLEANKRAMEQIKEGEQCSYIDSLARDYIKSEGYGDFFGHGLGHGVGLDIHEEPRFSPKCQVITKENMVITVEPGIYLPNRFGVRIEDLVVVTKKGYENLTHSDKELIILS